MIYGMLGEPISHALKVSNTVSNNCTTGYSCNLDLCAATTDFLGVEERSKYYARKLFEYCTQAAALVHTDTASPAQHGRLGGISQSSTTPVGYCTHGPEG